MKLFSLPKAKEVNELIGLKYKTNYGILQEANLDFALMKQDPGEMMEHILKTHPFIDGNKRTALALYLMSVEEKTLGEVLEQYSPLFEALSKV